MIPDWETNRLFISARLEDTHPQVVAGLLSTFPDLEVIPNTSDFWCRDYMPVQLSDNSFCQFTYRPDYLRGFKHLITPPNRCRLPFMEKYHVEPIVLAGGNVVASRTKVILTDKVYTENPSIERTRLRSRLEKLFQADCIFIPKEPFDPIGHADGMVRFVSEGCVLMNDYSTLDPGYGDKLRALLEKNGLVVDTLPMFEEECKSDGDIPSAVGLYINFLRVGNVVVLWFGAILPDEQPKLDSFATTRLQSTTLGDALPTWCAQQWGFLSWQVVAKKVNENEWPRTKATLDWNEGQIYREQTPVRYSIEKQAIALLNGRPVFVVDCGTQHCQVIHLDESDCGYFWMPTKVRAADLAPGDGRTPAGNLPHLPTSGTTYVWDSRGEFPVLPSEGPAGGLPEGSSVVVVKRPSWVTTRVRLPNNASSDTFLVYTHQLRRG